jgi:hypothetical protein
MEFPAAKGCQAAGIATFIPMGAEPRLAEDQPNELPSDPTLAKLHCLSRRNPKGD